MRSLADGHEKIAVLTTQPEDPSQPTVTELNAGIDASCAVLASDWTFGPTDSDTFAEPAVCEDSNAQSYGRSNGQFGATIFRHFATATPGQADATSDTTFAALKVKGTIVWVYSRLTAKKSAEAWAADDEIRYGAEVLTDTPQPPQEAGGYIKSRVPGQVQRSWPYIKAVTSIPG